MLANGVQRVNIGARAQQAIGRLPLVTQANPFDRRRHQRRRSARQQDQQNVVSTGVRGDFERAPARPFAPRRRNRMTAVDMFQTIWSWVFGLWSLLLGLGPL